MLQYVIGGNSRFRRKFVAKKQHYQNDNSLGLCYQNDNVAKMQSPGVLARFLLSAPIFCENQRGRFVINLESLQLIHLAIYEFYQ